MTMVYAWNWKSALTSAVCRAAIFFVINLQAGLSAGVAALQVEFTYRVVASGFYGALTQRFAQQRTTSATWTALAALPALAHGVEWVVHRWAGTPVLGSSMIASIAFSLVTTRFHLIAMQRGIMTVGPGSQSIAADLRAMPSAVAAFFRVS